MDLTCPRCYQYQVRKVSGIYKEQKRLPPPEEPTYEHLLPAGSSHIPIIHLLGHLVGYPMAIGFLLFTVLLACGTLGVGTVAGAGKGVFLFVLGSLLLIGGIIWKAKATMAARRAAFKEEYPRWQRAYQRWNQLYYCQVCDGLFVSNGQSPLMTEEEASYFLYTD